MGCKPCRALTPCLTRSLAASTARTNEEHRDHAMPFEEILDQAIDLLRRRGRVTYRTLQFQFDLDDERLKALVEALIEAEQLAADEAGKVLVWTPRAPEPLRTAPSTLVRDVLVLLLACVAGAVDALSYMGLGQVLTANMTGNTVLLGLALGQAETSAAVRSSIALAGFLVGASLGASVTSRGPLGSMGSPAVIVTLGVEWCLLVALGIGWHQSSDLDQSQAMQAALVMLSALAMGLQSAVGRHLNIPGIATTYITGTLVSLSAHVVTRARSAQAFPMGPVPLPPTADAVASRPILGLLAATWMIYIGGAATAAMSLTFSGPFLALALPVTILGAVILTAVSYFRR
jgi:uncharacterized membrane protein YoaK (UPF0700 family)